MRYESMKQITYQLKPQDIVILLKIITLGTDNWQQKPLAESLKMSQSEISQSVARSEYAALLFGNGKQVMRMALMDFLQYGIAYTFPQKPGAVVRGIPTAHSAAPLNKLIISNEQYVWPAATGTVRGHSIVPLYPSVPEAVKVDEKLYELLALVDALRIGRAREKELAIKALKQRILNGK
jgi:hypothetical protein